MSYDQFNQNPTSGPYPPNNKQPLGGSGMNAGGMGGSGMGPGMGGSGMGPGMGGSGMGPGSQFQQPGRPPFQQNPMPNPMADQDFTPISMWGYFGYELLFSIPCIGFIMLLVFSFGGTKNVNLRNFARSYFCFLIIALIIGAIFYFAILGGAVASSGRYYY